MKVNRITYYPAQVIPPAQKNTLPFCANPAKVKNTLVNCGMLAAIVGIGVWLEKPFREYPQSDSIFLNDGTYLGEVHELNELM